MTDIEKALADLATLRHQIARQTPFLGLGPAAIAATAGLALVVGFAQAFWIDERPDAVGFFAVWIGLAVVCVAIIGHEIHRRSRRMHTRLSDEMVFRAAESFVPVGGVGACLALVIARFAPEQIWMIPALWQMLVGLGIFASIRILPWQAGLVGGWYVLAGLGVLALASEQHLLSPVLMAIPFAVGQGALALVMHRYAGGQDE